MPKAIPLCLGVLLLLLLSYPSDAAAPPVTDAQVTEAIVRMQNWLLSKQHPETGRWGDEPPAEAVAAAMPEYERKRVNGDSVIATYALLISGRSAQEPAVERALRYIRDHEPWGTYGTAVRAHIWAELPDSYAPHLRRDAEWLLKAQRDGLWTYGPVRGKSLNHSATLYGTLGLWEFTKRGGRTPNQLWQNLLTHYLAYQGQDGGWAYDTQGDKAGAARGSMTAGGLTVLYIANQQLYPDGNWPPAVRDALHRGHQWLDRHFTVERNPQPGSRSGEGPLPWYYLYALERVALASGYKTFGGRDWFEAGAARILEIERGRGFIGRGGDAESSDVINTSLCLMFLARGRVPVWINKLQLDSGRWNNRPNDVYTLTRYLSDFCEAELNWQVVSLDMDPSEWCNPPVAWLSSDGPVELTEAQAANLKRYLALGGVLVANPESGGRGFADSIRKLGRELYPGRDFQPVPPDHPFLTLLTPVGSGPARNLQTLHNGVRDVIILPGQDWGRDFQTAREPGTGDAWRTMTNLYGTVTERGSLENRLVSRMEPRRTRPPRGTIAAARTRYGGGGWDAEQHAWEPLKTSLFNATGYELELGEIELAEAGSYPGALIHLAGVRPASLSESEREAIRRFVEAGGTVLVECLGGRGDFSLKLEEQLREALAAETLPVQSSAPLVTGQGLPDGRDVGRALFRQYSVLHMAARRNVRLSVMPVQGRPAIIFSHDDLSLGALGLKSWGINGYQTATARDLLINILLAAQQSRAGQASRPD